jgi:hypothetical protein
MPEANLVPCLCTGCMDTINKFHKHFFDTSQPTAGQEFSLEQSARIFDGSNIKSE